MTTTNEATKCNVDDTRTAIGIKDSIELLRGILSKQQGHAVRYAEAAEVGDALISFYEALAE